MRLPEHPLLRAATVLAALYLHPAMAQNAVVPAGFPTAELEELRESLEDTWYRTELLIFVREDNASRAAEGWDPLPELAYPETARFLVDPELADRRLAESLAYESRIDEQGVQTLTVPAPIRELLDHSRPDAITATPPAAMLDELLPGDDPNSPRAAGTNAPDSARDEQPLPGLNEDTSDPDTPADPNEPEPDLVSPVFALPYQTLADSELEFRAQARTLRRRGHRVLFHAAWWAPLDEAERTPSVLLDRSGDSDSLDWPALQGSVQVYRSRYLHIGVDLWLNTLGEYLPEGWQIDPPPRPRPSLATVTMAGESLDPWNPVTEPQRPESGYANAPAEGTAEQGALDPGSIETVSAQGLTGEREPLAAAAEPDPRADYPWHHAIVHRQSRRMRSGEIHYLDHPVIGVIVRVRAIDETYLPLLAPQEQDFRARHELPMERLEMPEPKVPESDGGENAG